MPKRPVEFFVVDILVSIDKTKRNTTNLNLDTFVSDENLFDSTMRDLEIIGEAAKHILQDSNFIKESKIDWRRIVDFRNIVAHEYFGIDMEIIFEIIKSKIPSLEKDILKLIKQKNDKTYILQAISDAKSELKQINRKESIAYLDKIENLIKK